MYIHFLNMYKISLFVYTKNSKNVYISLQQFVYILILYIQNTKNHQTPYIQNDVYTLFHSKTQYGMVYTLQCIYT